MKGALNLSNADARLVALALTERARAWSSDPTPERRADGRRIREIAGELVMAADASQDEAK